MNKQKCTHLDKTSECAVCGAEFELVPIKEEVGEKVIEHAGMYHYKSCSFPTVDAAVCNCPTGLRKLYKSTPPLEVKEGSKDIEWDWEKEFDKEFPYLNTKHYIANGEQKRFKSFIIKILSQQEAKIKRELVERIEKFIDNDENWEDDDHGTYPSYKKLSNYLKSY